MISDPDQTFAARPNAASVLSLQFQEQRLWYQSHFRGSIHTFNNRCQRFVPSSLMTTHDSLPVGGYPFPGRIDYLLDIIEVFHYLFCSPINPHLAGFAWRNENRCLTKNKHRIISNQHIALL
jgi:hypothetical protein